MAESLVETIVVPRPRDLGEGFQVLRVLPSGQRPTIGPFVFFDQMGPVKFRAGAGLDVRPHPHIGLATVTYLFDGEILHRDSLGTVQLIRPGAVNWMTAGRGIVHSERTPAEARRQPGASLFGAQTWVALPKHAEDMAPGFAHHEAETLPEIEDNGVRLRLIAGTLGGLQSPVAVFSPMFLAGAALDAGARFDVPAEHEERAIYVAAGRIAVGATGFESGRLLVLSPGQTAPIAASTQSRLLLLGGAPIDGHRHLWWNFV